MFIQQRQCRSVPVHSANHATPRTPEKPPRLWTIVHVRVRLDDYGWLDANSQGPFAS